MRKLLSLFTIWRDPDWRKLSLIGLAIVLIAAAGVQMDRIDSAGVNGELNAARYMGSGDIGAGVNAAYAASASGGTILIPASASCYLFSTPILINTNGKLVHLRGSGAGSTCLQWTGSNGTAITIDNYNGNGVAATLEDFELTTTVAGSTATLLSIGPTNFGSGTRVSRLWIHGGQTLALTQTYGAIFTDVEFGPCSSAASSVGFQAGANNFADDTRIRGGQIIGCSTLINNGSTNPLWVDHVILANATVGPWVSNSGALHFTDVHFFNQASGPVPNWFNNASPAVAYIHNSLFEDDKTSGSATSYISVSGGILVFTNNVLVSSGVTVTEAIQFSGSGQGFLSGNTVSNTAFIPALWNTSYGSGVVNIALPTNSPGSPTVFGPTQFRMDGTSCGPGIFDLFDTTGLNHKYLRLNANKLEFLNDACNTVIANLDNVGNFTAASSLKGALGLTVGSSGSLINAEYKGSGTLTYTAIGANACQEQPLTITGAASGDVCYGSPAADIGGNFSYGGCRVSGASTAQLRVCSGAGGTPSAVSWTGWATH